MHWQPLTFDWNRVRAFLVTAEEGSLSAAARALGMAQPTIGRQITALEAELGVALFERTGRSLILTPPGLELLQHARAMGKAAMALSLSASGQSQAIEGPIAISASEVYSAYLLPPVVRNLRASAPGIEIEIVASNALSDLQRREADIALRNTRPTQPELFAKMIVEDTGQLYATPGYLSRLGDPATPDDLTHAEFIGFDRSDMLRDGLNNMGLRLTQRNFPVITGNHLVQWELVKSGIGIGVFPTHVGDAEPCVRRVLPNFGPIRFPIWLVTHRELQTSRRVRLVFDLLAETIPRTVTSARTESS